MEFSFKDTYRAMIEFCSDGRNTVMYDEQDNPNVMVCITKYDMEVLGLTPGTHPAFIVGGKEVKEFWISKYQNTVGSGGVPISIAYADPMVVSGNEARVLCKKKGRGWHQMTNLEYAAMMLIQHKMGRGCYCALYNDDNNDAGNTARNHRPGLSSTTPVANDNNDGHYKSGTGPYVWSHNLSMYGVMDIIGNYWEIADGIRINANDGCIETWGTADYEYSNEFMSEKWVKTYWAIDSWNGDLYLDDIFEPSVHEEMIISKNFTDIKPPTTIPGEANLEATSDLNLPKAMMLFPIDSNILSYKNAFIDGISNTWVARFSPGTNSRYMFLRGGRMKKKKVLSPGVYSIDTTCDFNTKICAPRSVYIDI